MSDPVTVLVTRRVRPVRGTGVHRVAERTCARGGGISRPPGITVIPPPLTAADREYLIVFRFDSQAHLRVWQKSDARRTMLERSKSMADESPLERELTGMETWFAVPGGQVLRSPPAWKMWLLSSAAIYPLITLLSVVLGPLLGGLPVSVRFAITTPLLGALMTWLVMPRLSRLVAGWLYL